uniref:Uncharacterized protein n=1 Tax=Macrostomum lignano TaxID=282301 RepID=A0A1I8FCH7_9PLAT
MRSAGGTAVRTVTARRPKSGLWWCASRQLRTQLLTEDNRMA